MNIMLFMRNLKGRGASKNYINLAKALKLKGYNPYIVIRENIIDFDVNNLNVIVFEKDVTLNTQKFVKEKKIDFIISNNVPLIENIDFDKNKIFYTVHMLWGERLFNFPKIRFKKWLELKRDYKNKELIVGSEAIKNDLLYKVKIKPKKIHIIHTMFDFDEIEKKANKKIDLKNYIVSVISLTKEKNPHLLLKTYAKMKTDLDLVIVGKGPLENDLKKLANKLNIEKKVKFLGFQKNPYPYIKNAKLLIATSKNEGLLGVAVESLYLNTPVVSTDCKGVREVLKGDLEKFITNNPNKLVSLSKEALKNYPKIDKEKIKKEFGFSEVEKYEKLFRRN